jgi:hypothetical protein
MKFFSKNPYEGDLNGLITSLTQDILPPYERFVQHFVAYMYFYHLNDLWSPDHLVVDSPEQVYHLYLKGHIQIRTYDPYYHSPLTEFQSAEKETLDAIGPDYNRDYYAFIDASGTVCERLDALIDNRPYPTLSFETYTKDSLDHQNIAEVKKIVALFQELQDQFYRDVKLNLLRNFNLHHFEAKNYSGLVKHLGFYLTSALLSKSDQQHIQQLAINWLDYLIDHSVFHYNTTNLPEGFKVLKQLFSSRLNLPIDYPSDAETTPYPRSIFASAPAYLLFKAYAEMHTTKICISYLYRRMHEKENLILVKDTPFREWFNRQDYPIKLLSVTETYAKAHTTERQAHVDLLYKALGVNVELLSVTG